MEISSILVAGSSSGSGGVKGGRATNRLQHLVCGGVMHDMLMKLKKRSWCVPLSSVFNLTFSYPHAFSKEL